MNFSYVIYAVATMGGLAVLFGVMLGIASIKFHVEVDPKVEQIHKALPGSNCGACGFPGCEAAAEAIAKGDSPYDTCVAGGHEVAEKVADILGIKAAESVVKKVAMVRCGGGRSKTKSRFAYEGIHHCTAANQLIGGPLLCSYGCLGFGDCVESCPFEAMEMAGDGLPREIPEKCTACGICVQICPRKIIELLPEKAPILVKCNSHDKGKQVRQACSVGCIACKACEKVCEYDAIHVIDNLAVVDYNKCTACMACVEKCPTKCIIQLQEVAAAK